MTALPDEKHEQKLRVAVTILLTNADNAAMRRGVGTPRRIAALSVTMAA